MKRREFIHGSIAAAAAIVRPGLARGQTSLRVGVLAPGPSKAAADFIDELKAGLREDGFRDGENVRLETAFGQTHGALDDAAAQLLLSDVSVIVAWSTPAVGAAKRATSTKPIVMVGIADPIGAKFCRQPGSPGRQCHWHHQSLKGSKWQSPRLPAPGRPAGAPLRRSLKPVERGGGSSAERYGSRSSHAWPRTLHSRRDEGR
jgi:hypothetical protein